MVAVPREPESVSAGRLRGRSGSGSGRGGPGQGSGLGIDPYLVIVIAVADVCALGLLVIGQQVTTLAAAYPLIYAGYFLLSAAMAAFLRIAALARRGNWPGPGPGGPGGGGGGGWGPKRSIILALILMLVAIILVFTNVYYLANAPSYLSPVPRGILRDTWQQTMYMAVGVLCTVQSPPLLVSWAGFAGIVQELFDLLFLGGVVTIALSRV
jgi:hypothetical protein